MKPASGAPSQAEIQGRNVTAGGPLNARLTYVDARLTQLSPAQPLDLYHPEQSRIDVQAAEVQLTAAGINAAIADQLWQTRKGPVTSAKVTLQPGNNVQLAAWVRLKGIPVPVSASYQIERRSDTEIRLVPKGICAFGIPAQTLLAKLNIDLGALANMPANVPATVAADGTVTLDTTKVKNLNAPLTSIATGSNTLTIDVGTPPDPAARGQASGGWFELTTRGTAAAGPGKLQDATVSCTAPAGQDLPLFEWRSVAKARLESGCAAVDPAMIKDLVQKLEPAFKVDDITLTGTTYHVKGKFTLGLTLPTAIDLKLTLRPDGKLFVTTNDAHVCGFKLKGLAKDDFAQVSFLKPEGDGYVVDLDAAAGLDLPRVGQLANQGGQLVLKGPS